MPVVPPFEIALLAERNVIRTRYLGTVKAEHMLRAGDDLKKLLIGVPKGFTVLADLTSLDSMDVECGPLIGGIMELFKAAGVGRVIRVMPDRHKDIGMNILSLIHYRGKIPIRTYATLAEAEKDLG